MATDTKLCNATIYYCLPSGIRYGEQREHRQARSQPRKEMAALLNVASIHRCPHRKDVRPTNLANRLEIVAVCLLIFLIHWRFAGKTTGSGRMDGDNSVDKECSVW